MLLFSPKGPALGWMILLATTAWTQDSMTATEKKVSEKLTPVFQVLPYWVFPSETAQSCSEALDLLWITNAKNSQWVTWIRSGQKAWVKLPDPQRQAFEINKDIIRQPVNGIGWGQRGEYRILKDGQEVFRSEFIGRSAPGHPTRVALLSEGGTGSPAQIQIAKQVGDQQPGLLLFAGNVAFPYGRWSDFMDRFFPVFNAEDSKAGAQLLRVMPFAVAPGLRDLPSKDVSETALSLFEKGANDPKASAPRAITYGSVKFLLLDGGSSNWSQANRQKWLEEALRDVGPVNLWKVVILPAPPLNPIGRSTPDEHWKLLWPLLKKHGVPLVIAGQERVYQRLHPFDLILKTTGDPGKRIQSVPADILPYYSTQAGDGAKQGIHLVLAGNAGGKLEEPLGSRKPQILAFSYSKHVFLMLDANLNELVLRALDDKGKEIDRLVLRKP